MVKKKENSTEVNSENWDEEFSCNSDCYTYKICCEVCIESPFNNEDE